MLRHIIRLSQFVSVRKQTVTGPVSRSDDASICSYIRKPEIPFMVNALRPGLGNAGSRVRAGQGRAADRPGARNEPRPADRRVAEGARWGCPAGGGCVLVRPALAR